MQVPEKIQPSCLGDYLEVMSKSVFESGLSWRVVEAKWPGTKEAFRGFDPTTVAMFSEGDIDDLAKDKRVIRNRRKLAAVVENARQMLDLEELHGSFQAYLKSHGGFEQTLAELKKRFRFLGDMGAYHFLWVVNEEVPPYEIWCASHGRLPYRTA